jgi:hypothetical protein
MQEGLPRELWCHNFAHLMRVGLPICVLAKEVVGTASHLASEVIERRHPAVATRHVRKDNGLFLRSRTNEYEFIVHCAAHHTHFALHFLPIWCICVPSYRCVRGGFYFYHRAAYGCRSPTQDAAPPRISITRNHARGTSRSATTTSNDRKIKNNTSASKSRVKQLSLTQSVVLSTLPFITLSAPLSVLTLFPPNELALLSD